MEGSAARMLELDEFEVLASEELHVFAQTPHGR